MAASSLPTLLLSLLILLSHADGRRLGGASSSSTAAQFLNPHNALRAGMGLPPLQWSAKLANVALWYANQRKADCALVHSTLSYGENLFWGQGNSWRNGDAVKAWAAEQSEYDYRSNTCLHNTDCHHYTQLVWRTTQRVGCARVNCNSGDTFIVCEYDPHGNTIGERPY